MRALLVAVVLLSVVVPTVSHAASSGPGVYYYVENATIYMLNLSSGERKALNLFGVNWFGFETSDHVVHGLWARNWEDMLEQIKSLGFNAIRLPFCAESVKPGTMPSIINYYLNPDLQGLDSVTIMEKIVKKAGELGIYVLLDFHRIGCQYIEPLWYTDSFTEEDYIETWRMVAERFGKYWNVIGADIKNEPHSVSPPPTAYWDGKSATWGTGDPTTDWRLAAERIGEAILEVAPHWLIFVEGTQYTNPETDGSYEWGYNTWWGGNLMAVKDYPVGLPREKLVYSPHVYGPDVYDQPYFSDPNFPENMPGIWYHHFGYVKLELGYPVVIGEFGGKYGHGGDPRDVAWQQKLVDWMIENGFCSFFYWSWNPNSGDTGGLLRDDWQTVWEDKYENLKRLMDACSGGGGGAAGGPPIVLLEANTTSTVEGGVVQVKWAIVNASGWESNIASTNQGSKTIVVNSTTTLYIYAWNQWGSINKTLTITVSSTGGGSGDGDNDGSVLAEISYPEEEWPSALVDADGDGEYEYAIEINPWNIASATGTATMIFYANNTIHYVQKLDNIVLRNPGAWVHGYPEVFYGNKPWNSLAATSGPVPLPEKLENLTGFNVSIAYRLEPDPSLPMNLALEMWLTTDKWRTTGVGAGDVELMIWLYYQSGLQPAGSKVGEVVVPIKVNGTLVNASFEVWRASLGWEYIAFRIATPIKSANITLPVKPFMQAAAAVSETPGFWQLYLEDVEAGTEYGSPSTRSAHVEWWIYGFTLNPGNEAVAPPSQPQPPESPPRSGGQREDGASPASLEVELVNTWGSGSQYQVEISGVSGEWSLELCIADGSITDIWGADIVAENAGCYTVEPDPWNMGEHPVVGLIVQGDTPFLVNASLYLGGVVAANWSAGGGSSGEGSISDSVEASLVIENEWDTGFVAKIYLENKGGTPIAGWRITVEMTSIITSIWGAVIESEKDTVITLAPADYNTVIPPGDRIELGFVALKAGEHPYPEIANYTYIPG